LNVAIILLVAVFEMPVVKEKIENALWFERKKGEMNGSSIFNRLKGTIWVVARTSVHSECKCRGLFNAGIIGVPATTESG
jgi:ABC-type phosphate transport system permease subunit